jgi:FkbM family methyltransferase
MLSKLLRDMPPFRGKTRLAHFLLGSEVKNRKDIVIRGKFDCSYFVPNVVENVGFDILINGIYEEQTHTLLNDLIPQGGSFLDIGGNIGSITVPLCKKRPDIMAIAVEAAPWIFPYLERNIRDNEIPNVKLANNAIYDQDGLEMDFYSPADKFGKGSLASVFTNKSEKVVSKTLDTLVKEHGIATVDVVKVDVEGFEYFVFKGGQRLLSGEHRPTVFFEFVDWAERNAQGLAAGTAQQYMLDIGYDLYIITEKNARVKIESPVINGSHNILAQKGN